MMISCDRGRGGGQYNEGAGRPPSPPATPGPGQEVRFLGDMVVDDLITAVEILEPVHFNRVITRDATKDQLLAVPRGPTATCM